ncbi:GntR family transcriptional regulator [Mesorhizobium sp.]|uniref:GntR family transcriptional regulator n=1 Tax=Mesorhizobium sp. TaxID=1871066 RepID=UPI000FE82941|nr:GntR family transcriptional regulator [Mesorhizobium sp.]RWI89899.1 MAG: GntR family transcriptional regulator [Mesorhizobium sp.]
MDLYSTLSLWLTNIRSLAELDDFCRQIWTLYGEESLGEDDAERLCEKADRQRAEIKNTRTQGCALPRSCYPQRPRSERSRRDAAHGPRDPARWRRKRRLARMQAVRPEFAGEFTEGESAALYIVMSDCRQHGKCDRSVREIGDRAGVGATTVRNALRKASTLGLLRVTQRRRWRARNLPNHIVVVHRRQIDWIAKFRPNLGLKFYPTGFKKAAPTGSSRNKNSGTPFGSRSNSPSDDVKSFAIHEPSTG